MDIFRDTINHHCNLLETHGTDFWWTLPTADLLPENQHSSLDFQSIEKGQVNMSDFQKKL